MAITRFRQRRFAVGMFAIGFLQWILLIVIGTFIRGPGWIWFWPGQTWDHNAVVFDKNLDLHDIVADMTGFTMLSIRHGCSKVNLRPHRRGRLFFIVGALFFHWLMTRRI